MTSINPSTSSFYAPNSLAASQPTNPAQQPPYTRDTRGNVVFPYDANMLGYSPQDQPLFAQSAQQATDSPFVLGAAGIGANQSLFEATQKKLIDQGVNLSAEQVASSIPPEFLAENGQRQEKTLDQVKQQLHEKAPQRRNLLQNVIDFGLPTIVGIGVTALSLPLGPGAVALGAAAAAATAAVTNTAVQKGAFSEQGFDWNRKIDKFELATSVVLNMLPIGGFGGGKLAVRGVQRLLGRELVEGSAKHAAVKYAGQGAVRGAVIGGSVEGARQAYNGESLNLGRIATSAITGGTVGAVTGGATGAAGTKWAARTNKINGTQVTMPKYGTINESLDTIGGGVGATKTAAAKAAQTAWQAPGEALNSVKNKLSRTPSSAPPAESVQLELDLTGPATPPTRRAAPVTPPVTPLTVSSAVASGAAPASTGNWFRRTLSWLNPFSKPLATTPPIA